MQLWFLTVGSGGGYVKIYDDSTTVPYSDFDAKASGPNSYPTFKPDFSANIQEDDIFTVPDNSGNTAVNSFRQPLSNVKGQTQVVLNAVYSKYDDSFASLRTFSALLQKKVHFKVIQGAEVQYYPNATVTRYSGNPSGLGCTHEFTFKSDVVTANAP